MSSRDRISRYRAVIASKAQEGISPDVGRGVLSTGRAAGRARAPRRTPRASGSGRRRARRCRSPRRPEFRPSCSRSRVSSSRSRTVIRAVCMDCSIITLIVFAATSPRARRRASGGSVTLPLSIRYRVPRPCSGGLSAPCPGHPRDDHIRTGGPVDEQVAIDFHRRKDDGERGGGQQHLAVELQVPGLRDQRHVPDPGLAVIDVGGAHEQQTILIGGRGHPLQRLLGDILGDHFAQRSGIPERVGTGHEVDDRSLLVDVVTGDLGVHLLQLGVVGRGAEKRVGGQQRAGADTADHVELRPPPAFAPADEETGAEGAVLAAAGEGQQCSTRVRACAPGSG